MSRDVAQRDQDQAGHRIVNLGDPKSPGDATKVDTKNIPKAASGSGSAGTSFLAAPADHVHPATGGGGGGGWVTLDDPSMQSVQGGPFVIWEQAVDFSAIPGDKVACTVAAIVRQVGGGTGKVELKIGGDFNDPDGTSVASFETTKDESELKKKSAEIEKPEGLALVKVLASTKGSQGKLLVRGKSISFVRQR